MCGEFDLITLVLAVFCRYWQRGKSKAWVQMSASYSMCFNQSKKHSDIGVVSFRVLTRLGMSDGFCRHKSYETVIGPDGLESQSWQEFLGCFRNVYAMHRLQRRAGLACEPGQRVTPEIQAESMLDLTAVMVHSKAESKQCYQCNAKSFEVLISLDLQLERSTILTIDIYRLYYTFLSFFCGQVNQRGTVKWPGTELEDRDVSQAAIKGFQNLKEDHPQPSSSNNNVSIGSADGSNSSSSSSSSRIIVLILVLILVLVLFRHGVSTQLAFLFLFTCGFRIHWWKLAKSETLRWREDKVVLYSKTSMHEECCQLKCNLTASAPSKPFFAEDIQVPLYKWLTHIHA